jgi:hypothetical protein
MNRRMLPQVRGLCNCATATALALALAVADLMPWCMSKSGRRKIPAEMLIPIRRHGKEFTVVRLVNSMAEPSCVKL